MGWEMFSVTILTGGDSAQVAAFNYFFSLMVNMMVVIFVPVILLYLVWNAGKQ